MAAAAVVRHDRLECDPQTGLRANIASGAAYSNDHNPGFVVVAVRYPSSIEPLDVWSKRYENWLLPDVHTPMNVDDNTGRVKIYLVPECSLGTKLLKDALPDDAAAAAVPRRSGRCPPADIGVAGKRGTSIDVPTLLGS